MTTLTDATGRELTFPSTMLFDAWLRVVAGEPVGLPLRTMLFLSRAKLRRSEGEMLIALRDECRAAITQGVEE